MNVLKAVSFGCALGILAVASADAQNSLLDVGKTLLQNQGGVAGVLGSASGAGLSTGEIGSGLKEALKVASERVTAQLGAKDGFNGNSLIHIPLPGSLKSVQEGLKLAGQSALLDDLELKMNRAAEQATPAAKKLFLDAISKMSFDDAKGILTGPQDAATQYFKRTMSPDLRVAMRPLVDKTVSESGAVKAYQNVAGSAQSLPLIGQAVQGGPGLLTDQVLDYALQGIFTYLGQEEAAIRSDPAKQTTSLLRKVFAK
jgi:hypothetical protein